MTKVGGMPHRAAGTRTNYRDWAAVAKALKASPGEPVLLPEFTNTDKVEALQIQVNYSIPPLALRELGGAVKGFIRNSQIMPTEAGRPGRRGDLWLLWVPEGYTLNEEGTEATA